MTDPSKIRQPDLPTSRLVLRPFVSEDASEVQRLAGEREIAANTLRIPHPYSLEMAREWIGSLAGSFDHSEQVVFAVVRATDHQLVGAVGLVIDPDNRAAEMGYWIGKPYWSQGYCTEAARKVLDYGFEQLGLNRIFASTFRRNTASARVLQKLGMVLEGTARQAILKWGRYEDLEIYAMLEDDFRRARRHDGPSSS